MQSIEQKVTNIDAENVTYDTIIGMCIFSPAYQFAKLAIFSRPRYFKTNYYSKTHTTATITDESENCFNFYPHYDYAQAVYLVSLYTPFT
jgi:hypothetical protein